MSDFYMTLPSNTSAENSLNNFTVDLPRRIELVGDWEVGLVELQYPYTWYNFSKANVDNLIEYKKADKSYVIPLPMLRYTSVQHLLQTIKFYIKQYSGEDIAIDFVKKYDKVEFEYKLDEDLIVSLKIMYMLGYEDRALKSSGLQYYEFPNKYKSVAMHPPDMTAGMYSLYVYCNIVSPQLVGTSEVRLLQVVNVTGKYGQYVTKEYNIPHYVPVLQKQFDRIEVNIKDDTGSYIPFQFGKIVVKLHFRKKRR